VTRAALLLLALAIGCGAPEAGPPRELSELALRDSTYFAPETDLPYSGRVTSTFVLHPDRTQVEGKMLDGQWHGELRIYHRDGRVRYEGRLEHGVRCGVWTENTDPRPASNLYEELVTEIESMGIYPPCSDERGK
jgi:hypothetical protein